MCHFLPGIALLGISYAICVLVSGLLMGAPMYDPLRDAPVALPV